LIYSPEAIDDRFKERGCVGFWFYAKDTPQDTIKNTTLLQIRGKDCKNEILFKVNSDLGVWLYIYNNQGKEIVYAMTSTTCIKNQWNFIGFNFSYRDIEGEDSKVQSFMLQLNDEVQEKAAKIEMSFLSSATYHIGHEMNSSNQVVNSIGTYITGLILGLRKNITTQEMKDYYCMSKDYILRPAYDESNLIYHSSVSTHNLSADNAKYYEIYPLHHHPNSIKGKKPIAFDIRGTETHDLTFGYNLKSKRYAYMADEGRLEYSLDMTRTGTILMRAFIKEEANKRYLFECKDSNKQKFGLYILNSDVYLECNGTSNKTALEFKSNEWHTVGISFDGPPAKDSVTPIKVTSLRVYVDGKQYTTSVSLDSFSNLKLSLGRKFDPVTIKNLYDGYETFTYQPLCGQIEMLATRAAYCEESTLNALSNELKDSTKIREYDGFGRLSKLELNESDVNILSHEYIYTSKKETSTSIENLSHQISQEKISMGGKYPISRSYQIDALGNVTSISDGTFGFHSYTYNNRGFLTKEKLTVYIRDNNGKVSTKKEESLDYSYDENGNILKAGTTSFSYDSTIKDRLDKVNNATIYYSSTNPLNPSSYKNNSYTFEGRRLVKVKKDYGSSYDEITYEYNDEGLRTAKYIYHGFYDDTEEYGEDYKYYYEQDKLITEIGPEARLDFLYDENDELYGFIKDTKDKYYYVRDFMKNILGIIDNKGNLVVQYSYT
ncbi:MAG: hypothetical protein K2G50_00880, partial [Anaeroplasmataceae bacterium]|nr:hypothetical protein [Anaeroplasmataceae bacterium]